MLQAETEANILASGLEALLSAVIPHIVLDYWAALRSWLFDDHVTAGVIQYNNLRECGST